MREMSSFPLEKGENTRKLNTQRSAAFSLFKIMRSCHLIFICTMFHLCKSRDHGLLRVLKDNHLLCDQKGKKKKASPWVAHFPFYFLWSACCPDAIRRGEACNLSGFHFNCIVRELLLKRRAAAAAAAGRG